ncbi:hypothetical protein [Streptomyces tropicalis]|uniref:Secreted protein n=1 Tax=Streptomyces tropicalis TaxID=3034234 RepID=A0ABT6A8Q3_9ACTN|nr:hypothetical protein [Streptomyces tropicalis]MDF3300817.1 hypothetical protein [Streptomyces tropicalis]
MFSRLAKRAAVLAVISACAMGVSVTPSSAAGEHTFTPQQPSYNGNDPRGNFSAQIKYSGDKLQWGWQLSTATAAPATGLMTERADLYCNGRSVAHDSHPGVSPRYFVHASASLGSRMTSCKWDLKVHETFPIGRGTRTIDLDFPFVVTLV